MAKKPEVRELTRYLVGGLLMSGMTSGELKKLAQSSFEFEELSRQLRSSLLTASTLFEESPSQTPEEDQNPKSDVDTQILDLIKRRRLSKVEVIGVLTSVNPKFPAPRYQHSTLAELITRFVDQANLKEVREVVRLLSGPPSPDPYLTNLLSRDKRRPG